MSAENIDNERAEPYAKAVKDDGIDRRHTLTAEHETKITYLKIARRAA
jgi:hypothetical protein